MVVIEPVPTGNEDNNNRLNAKLGPSTSTSTSTSPPPSVEDAATAPPPPPVVAAGYASDGFETASDTELNDAEDDSPQPHNNNATKNTTREDCDKHCQQEEQKHQDQSVPPQDPSSEDALNEDQLSQKALERASDAKLEGNKLFGEGRYEEALLKYDLALQVVQDMPLSAEMRSICHANRATCFFKLEKYEDSVKECTKALELNATYMKALLRRSEAHEKLEHYEEAISDMTKILELDPSHNQARRAIARLKPLADKKREEMKEEMMGKLKEMGNNILGRFGMSIDNFKAVKDPNTGAYSISFQQ